MCLDVERFPSAPHIFAGTPANQTVLLNSTATFECKTMSDLEPYIQWFKTNTSVSNKTDDMSHDKLIQVMSTYTSGDGQW